MESVQLVDKSGIIQYGLSAMQGDVSLHFDPGLAAAIAREHGQIDSLRQPINPNGQGKNIFRFAPIEALFDDFIAPNVLPSQSASCVQRIELPPIDDFGEELESQEVGWRKQWRDFIKTFLRARQNGIALLVKQGWKQKELRMLHLKTAPALGNTSLAQDNDLLTLVQGIHDDGPFFECDSHNLKLL